MMDRFLNIAAVFGAIGAAAWLLIAFGYNIFDLLADWPTLTRVIQGVAGIGGLMMLKKYF